MACACIPFVMSTVAVSSLFVPLSLIPLLLFRFESIPTGTSRHFDDQQPAAATAGRELMATSFSAALGGGQTAAGVLERDLWLSTLHQDAPLADATVRKQITESCYMTAVGEIHALLDEAQAYPDARNAMPLPERQRKADECIARALRVAAEGSGSGSGMGYASSLSTGFQDMLFGMLRDEGHKQVNERERMRD